MIRDHSDRGRSNQLMNPFPEWIHGFDLPGSERSRITDPDPVHLKGTHPRCSYNLNLRVLLFSDLLILFFLVNLEPISTLFTNIVCSPQSTFYTWSMFYT